MVPSYMPNSQLVHIWAQVRIILKMAESNGHDVQKAPDEISWDSLPSNHVMHFCVHFVPTHLLK